MNVTRLGALKGQRPIVCLTAYTAYMSRLLSPFVDVLLVGDSLGMVLYGLESTVPVTMDMMVRHGRAVTGAAQGPLCVVDMPFGSYQESPSAAFASAAILMKETGCAAVKLEGGAEMAETIRFLCERGIPVMAHIGLKPQSVHAHGGYRMTGKTDAEAELVMNDARAVCDAGAFSVVLECVDSALAATITSSISCPTIGIGSAGHCDGQILVTEDLLGIAGQKVPSFVRQYASLSTEIEKAASAYAEDVRGRRFP